MNNEWYNQQSDLFKKGYEMIRDAKTIYEIRSIQRAVRAGTRLTPQEKEDLETFAINTISEM